MFAKAAAALLALTVLAACSDPDAIAVPAIVDLPVDEAKAAIEEVGLLLDVEDHGPEGRSVRVHSNWTVVRQDPAGGVRLEPGATVVAGALKNTELAGNADAEQHSEDEATRPEVSPEPQPVSLEMWASHVGPIADEMAERLDRWAAQMDAVAAGRLDLMEYGMLARAHFIAIFRHVKSLEEAEPPPLQVAKVHELYLTALARFMASAERAVDCADTEDPSLCELSADLMEEGRELLREATDELETALQ